MSLREARGGTLAAAIDNDLILKAACYGLVEGLRGGREVGVLGAARYVVGGRIKRMPLAGSRRAAQERAAEFFESSTKLEPTESELRLAVDVETAAQRRGLELDSGESQLAAIVILRSISLLETGDKRAIRALEALLDAVDGLADLAGRVRCLEQIVLAGLDECDADKIATAICSERDLDKTLSICCGCFSPPRHSFSVDAACLRSYIETLRRSAPRVLAG